MLSGLTSYINQPWKYILHIMIMKKISDKDGELGKLEGSLAWGSLCGAWESLGELGGLNVEVNQ